MEYLAYLHNLDLPDPKDLLAYPAKFGELRRSDQQFAALDAVVATVATADRKHVGATRFVCASSPRAVEPPTSPRQPRCA